MKKFLSPSFLIALLCIHAVSFASIGKIVFMHINQNAKVWFLILTVLGAGGLNRVFYKILITPLTNNHDRMSYAFFLSTCNAVFYVLVHGFMTCVRLITGRTCKKMLLYPWKAYATPMKRNLRVTRLPPLLLFVLIGSLDGIGGVVGLLAAPYISGVMISMMMQSMIFFSMLASIVLLKARYTAWQVLGIAIVLSGTVMALLPDLLECEEGREALHFGDMSTRKYVGYHVLMAVSTLPYAISYTLREVIFMKCPKLDIFIVNLHASLWQAILSPVMITLTVTFNIMLKQTQQKSFSDFLLNGIYCILAQKNRMEDDQIRCSALREPLWPSLPFTLPYFCYISCNLCLNVSLVLLVKNASALQCFMALKAILPIAVSLFFFHWPMLVPQTPSVFVIGGLFIVLLGLFIFRQSTVMKDRYRGLHGEKAVSCFSTFPLKLWNARQNPTNRPSV
ncbi:transmembrane protein [Perkinsela sp. CCAP 1560/4]|nr:transmembrane protein [Perkinsela sp. CCAP 1560/4]|eukprot:KNH08616.1 transmembrane protein [Perkinsela sp. CCAP 1560/4]